MCVLCWMLDSNFGQHFKLLQIEKNHCAEPSDLVLQQNLSTRNKYISSGIKMNTNIALVKESESGFWGLVVGSQADVVIDLIN